MAKIYEGTDCSQSYENNIKYYYINLENRKIESPEILGVQADHNTNRICFITDLIYNDTELNSLNGQIDFYDADGNPGTYYISNGSDLDGTNPDLLNCLLLAEFYIPYQFSEYKIPSKTENNSQDESKSFYIETEVSSDTFKENEFYTIEEQENGTFVVNLATTYNNNNTYYLHYCEDHKKIIIPWLIQNTVSGAAGLVQYSVQLYSEQEKKIKKLLNTQITTSKILKGLEVAEEMESEYGSNWIQQLRSATSTDQMGYILAAASPTDASILYTNSAITMSNGVINGAIWNDYAEYREGTDIFEAGRTVKENGNDTLSLCTERLEPGVSIVSDTFGFIIGKSDINGAPIAVSGRALAYPYEDRNSYKPGDAVCSGPNGTVSKMTREEIREYPERIIGTVSAVPDYENWGTGNVKIDGRIWIKIR